MDGSRSRAHATLTLLTLVYALNFVDRQLLAVLIEPIRAELGISDTRMGFLTGTAFALFYTCAGIPLARWADRGPRKAILVGGLVLWSALTAASGLARSYVQLALSRVGVGVGEAACTPPAHSLIADHYAREHRASAIAIYSAGIYVGNFVALALGGWLAERYGWRNTFVLVGLPGVVLALLVALAIREPAREVVASNQGASVREILALPAFFHVALGAGVKSIGGYGLLQWAPAFVERIHGMSPAATGAWLGPIVGIGGAVGTLGGGWLADRLGRRDERARMRMAAIATLAALPFVGVFLFARDARIAMIAYAPACVFGAAYLAPVFALAQNVVRADQRATASAILLFVINLIGLGIGPWLVGALNDALARTFGPDAFRWSLALVSLTYAWGAFHMLAAANKSPRNA